MNPQVLWVQQVLVGITTAAFASFFTTYLNNRYQRLREDKKWHKEKLFEVYSKCIFTAILATQLARTQFGSDLERFSKRTEAIIELLASLNILLVLCFGEQKDAIVVIRNETDQILQQDLSALLNISSEPLEDIRNRLVQLMQSDSKLKDIGK